MGGVSYSDHLFVTALNAGPVWHLATVDTHASATGRAVAEPTKVAELLIKERFNDQRHLQTHRDPRFHVPAIDDAEGGRMRFGQDPPMERPVTCKLRHAASELGFELSCTPRTGALLAVLAASKPAGRLLELGTGVGVGTSYLAARLGPSASLVTIELDPTLQTVARQFLGGTPRICFVNTDAAEYLLTCTERFDLIFADTWPGKFTHLSQAVDRLTVGGLYIIDDLLPQPTWPDGHAQKVPQLLNSLAGFAFLERVEMQWDTGIAIYVRTNL
jgi:predicted O-methyltransferase YrrM